MGENHNIGVGRSRGFLTAITPSDLPGTLLRTNLSGGPVFESQSTANQVSPLWRCGKSPEHRRTR